MDCSFSKDAIMRLHLSKKNNPLLKGMQTLAQVEAAV